MAAMLSQRDHWALLLASMYSPLNLLSLTGNTYREDYEVVCVCVNMAQCCVGIGVGEHRHTSLEKRRETGGSCSRVSHRKLYESRVPYCGKIYTRMRART